MFKDFVYILYYTLVSFRVVFSSLRIVFWYVHGVPSATPCGDPKCLLGVCCQQLGEVERGCESGGEVPKRGGGEREERGRGDQSMLFFKKKKKKPIHLRGECRHQFRVLEEFKRGVDVTHENWFGVRERTHLLGEHPLHP
ncbi:hypothetical protein Hanom_Chr12g01105891 [Helianthus anomalus]